MKSINVDAPVAERRLKALAYGKSGTGKTNFGVSAPRPLILLNEMQAVVNIREAAKRLGKPMPSVLHMESVEDYRSVVRACMGDRSKPFVVKNEEGVAVLTLEAWPETLVLDSLTEACSIIAEGIRKESPPKTGKDGLPVDSERFWNVFQDRVSKLVRSFRDVDMNVLFLCLLDDKVYGEGDDAVRWVGPQMPMRKLPGVVQAAVNVVGVTGRRLKKDASGELVPEYLISTIGPDYMETKPFPPLRKVEVTDFTSWCERINGRGDEPPIDVLPIELDLDKPADVQSVGEMKASKDAATKKSKSPTETSKEAR